VTGSISSPASLGLTDEQLRSKAVVVEGTGIGKVDDPMGAGDGSGSTSIVGGIKRVIAQLGTLLSRTPVTGKKTNATSVPVALSEEQEFLLTTIAQKITDSVTVNLDTRNRLPASLAGGATNPALNVFISNPGDISGGGTGTGSSSTASPYYIEDFLANAVAADYSKSDLIRKITVFNTQVNPVTVVSSWYNITQSKVIAEPLATDLKDRQQQILTPDQISKYRVIKPVAGTPVTVGGLETLLSGKITSITVLQESGTGKITGDTAESWDMVAGSTMVIDGGSTQALGILSSDIGILNVSGVMRLGVSFRKTGASISNTVTVAHVLDATSLPVDSTGGNLNQA
jgi:hypothetical protein